MKKWGWVWWVVITGYYVGFLFIPRGIINLAIVLSFLPFIVLGFFSSSAYRRMIEYLSYNHAEAWGRIAGEQEMRAVGRFRPSLFTLDQEIYDSEYEKLKDQYRRVSRIFIFAFCACLVTVFIIATR